MAANPDGDAARLHWSRLAADVGELVELPLEGGIVLGPQFSEDAHTLIAVGTAPGIGIESDGFEFLLHPSHAGAQGDATIGEDIEGSEHFRRHHRIAIGED
jgi:hypothetical protein